MNVPIEAIERIEIVRGPMSVFYGTGAFFGVINVITHKAENRGKSISWAAGLGGEGTQKASVKALGQEGGLAMSATAGIYRTDGRTRFDYTQLGENLRPGTTDRLLFEENRYFHLAGGLGGFSADLSYNEMSSNKQAFTQPDTDPEGIVWLRQARCALGYTHAFSSQLEARVRFQYSFFVNEMDFDFGIARDSWEWEQFNSRVLEVDADAIWRPRTNLSLLLGANQIREMDPRLITDVPILGFNRAMTYTGGDAIVTEAVYSQLDLTLSPTLKMVAGCRLDRRNAFTLKYLNNAHMQYIDPDTTLGLARYENRRQYSGDQVDWIPQAALIWRPNERHLVKLLYGEASNRANFFMLYKHGSKS